MFFFSPGPSTTNFVLSSVLETNQLVALLRIKSVKFARNKPRDWLFSSVLKGLNLVALGPDAIYQNKTQHVPMYEQKCFGNMVFGISSLNLSLAMFLRCFLIFREFEPHFSY